MEEKLSLSVYNGRPTGGTGILVCNQMSTGKFVVTVSTGSSRVTALRLFNVGSQDIVVCSIYENLYSPHNSDSSSDKIYTKYTTKIIKINLIRT